MPRGKRTSSSMAAAATGPALTTVPIPVPPFTDEILTATENGPRKRASRRNTSRTTDAVEALSTNPDVNSEVFDAPVALRASPDAEEKGESLDIEKVGLGKAAKRSAGAAAAAGTSIPKAKKAEAQEPRFLDPEADGDEEEADEEEIQAALSRPPPVNSDYLPLPWKGRLGYACLCTYLRFSNPPVFSSRTCRIASILENRHPLKDPHQPPHATKNRPDREQPASLARGQAYVESLGLANAKDIVKMLRWNERFGIRFLRLSSEMFPFASHEEYGYKLAPFASEALADAGKVATELGHRLTTHPGQYTQLGSPRKSVIDNALRDLDYHAELLSLLKMPAQQDRDAVMILHLGGVFGDKAATLDRFRENYARLPQGVKNRIVLENDDVSYSVHELLPLCEELNIPLVLDFHHHNIIFDPEQIREGTKDIVELYPRILATWKRKNITPKMHYSEPTPAAITGRQRRKHSPRVATLPPCPPNMDLMIEAKDKEQAVFELMRTFKLPGFETFNDMIPHVRKDDNKPVKPPPKKKTKTPKKAKKVVKTEDEALEDAEEAMEAEAEAQAEQVIISEEEVGMGGPEGRVYWPPTMEHWLRPVKRVIVKKEKSVGSGDEKKAESNAKTKKLTPAQKRKAATATATSDGEADVKRESGSLNLAVNATPTPAKRAKVTPKAKGKKTATASAASKKTAKSVPTPSTSDEDEDASDNLSELSDSSSGGVCASSPPPPSAKTKVKAKIPPERKSARASKVNYAVDGNSD